MSDLFSRLVRIVNDEWEFFGKSIIKLNGENLISKKETDTDASERIGNYWKFIGGIFSDLTGKDVDTPWSAAFISYCFNKAGSENKFPYSASHSRYINIAIQNSTSRSVARYPLVGHRKSDYAPKVGDLVCYARGQKNIYFDNAAENAYYTSHSDIVIDVASDYISVIGGNVSNSVTLKELSIDQNGLLNDKKYNWFCIIENKL